MTPSAYRRSDYALLRDTGYGVGVSWTSCTLRRGGPALPFEQAVEAFDVGRFVEQVAATGAGHVLFTANHVHQYLPCPNEPLDAVLPGRTCRRDLIMELADALDEAGIRLVLYYNHGICGRDEPWAVACGAKEPDGRRFFQTWSSIVGWMGRRYGPKVIAWWFDGGKTYRPWGAEAWPQMAVVAKEGFADRLICYNNALEATASLTECEDYWAGEIARINYVPRGALTPAGLPWYAYLDWHAHHDSMWAGIWGMWKDEYLTCGWPAPSAQTVAEFYLRFRDCGGTVTYNLLIDQGGAIIPEDLAVMARVRRLLRPATAKTSRKGTAS